MSGARTARCDDVIKVPLVGPYSVNRRLLLPAAKGVVGNSEERMLLGAARCGRLSRLLIYR